MHLYDLLSESVSSNSTTSQHMPGFEGPGSAPNGNNSNLGKSLNTNQMRAVLNLLMRFFGEIESDTFIYINSTQSKIKLGWKLKKNLRTTVQLNSAQSDIVVPIASKIPVT